jgi:hypothetical protein
MRMLFKLCIAYLLTSLPLLSHAAGFAYDGQHSKLAEHKILTAGTITIKNRVQNPKSSSFEAKKKLFELNDNCFYADYFIDYAPALLLLDKYGQTKVAVFNIKSSDLSVSIEQVRVLNCADIDKSDVQKTLDDIEYMLQQSKRREMEIKELQQQIRESERMESERRNRVKK